LQVIELGNGSSGLVGKRDAVWLCRPIPKDLMILMDRLGSTGFHQSDRPSSF
jgi:hypothetical protein